MGNWVDARENRLQIERERMREKEGGGGRGEGRGASSIEDRASIDVKLELEIVAQEPRKGFEEARAERKSKRTNESLESIERKRRDASDRRFSRSFEFSSIKLTAFRWPGLPSVVTPGV